MSPQWLPDSRHLLFVSNRDGPRGVYVVEVGSDGPRGSPTKRAGCSGSPLHLDLCGRQETRLLQVQRGTEHLVDSRFQNPESVRSSDAVPVTTDNQVIELALVVPGR